MAEATAPFAASPPVSTASRSLGAGVKLADRSATSSPTTAPTRDPPAPPGTAESGTNVTSRTARDPSVAPTSGAPADPGPAPGHLADLHDESLGRVAAVKPHEVLGLDQIDLSDLDFWTRPWEEREGAFLTLRRHDPMAFFDEPDATEDSALAPPPGPGYRALTRHADVTEVSRHPEIYLSGPGAVSILDMPTEMVEYFSGMISTDNPRHARLRRIVSAAFSPADGAQHRGPHPTRGRHRHRRRVRAG